MSPKSAPNVNNADISQISKQSYFVFIIILPLNVSFKNEMLKEKKYRKTTELHISIQIQQQMKSQAMGRKVEVSGAQVHS